MLLTLSPLQGDVDGAIAALKDLKTALDTKQKVRLK